MSIFLSSNFGAPTRALSSDERWSGNRRAFSYLSHVGCKQREKPAAAAALDVQRAIAASPTKPLSVVSNTFPLSGVSTFLVSRCSGLSQICSRRAQIFGWFSSFCHTRTPGVAVYKENALFSLSPKASRTSHQLKWTEENPAASLSRAKRLDNCDCHWCSVVWTLHGIAIALRRIQWRKIQFSWGKKRAANGLFGHSLEAQNEFARSRRKCGR